jgi:hypothetical protein
MDMDAASLSSFSCSEYAELRYPICLNITARWNERYPSRRNKRCRPIRGAWSWRQGSRRGLDCIQVGQPEAQEWLFWLSRGIVAG